jgi:phosphate transport system protein
MEISTKILREELTKMATLVESILAHCLDDEVSLDQLLKSEKKVDDYHKHIDDLVFKFIALKAPAARDLREALSIMKINTDLERIADQSIVTKRYWDTFDTPYREVLKMREEVAGMVSQCLNSFTHHDINLAESTIKQDQLINQINKSLALKFITLMKEDKLLFDEGFAVIRVVKNLERIADLATNICEDVIFLESGADVRHQASRDQDPVNET